MSASIYTQSKFYGLSIGVNLVGTASLFLVEFGEEYTFTLPSAYARSILTVPWCELGGKVLLQCKKSGYSAEIVFHTKVRPVCRCITIDITLCVSVTSCHYNDDMSLIIRFPFFPSCSLFTAVNCIALRRKSFSKRQRSLFVKSMANGIPIMNLP